MDHHQVVPDLLDTIPPDQTRVVYPGELEVKFGAELTPTQVSRPPVEVSWTPNSPGSLYTLILSDPDASSRSYPALREVLHWLVVNIPGGAAIDPSQGDTILAYSGAGPPERTGLHRYVFVVFHQSSGALCADTLRSVYTAHRRLHFNTRSFARQFSLGQPVSGTLFLAEFDMYVRTHRAAKLAVAFSEQRVVPDVVDHCPPAPAEVKYPSGLMMMLGRQLTPAQVQHVPDFVIWPTDNDSVGTLYTVCLIDADSTTPEFLQWLVVNIPGSDQLASGDTLVQYVGADHSIVANTTTTTKVHRHILLVYKQSNRLVPEQTLTVRAAFRIREFAQRYQLGEAVAGNLYQTD